MRAARQRGVNQAGGALNEIMASIKTVAAIVSEIADRVVVMSAGPASRPVGDVEITLPRPRNVSEINMSDAFIRLYREIWSILGTEVEKSHAVQH